MAKTIVVCGFGPGISTAVAEKFGQQGFSVALVARNAERLEGGVRALAARGIRAAAFPTDLADPAAVHELMGTIHSQLGPITVVHWNAYGDAAADLLSARSAELHAIFEVPVIGLLAALQASLADLRSQKDAALLVTNGGLGLFDPQFDVQAVQWGTMGLAVANAAKHKVVGLLSEKLKPDGIYVGEVMVLGLIQGTPWDQGNATIPASRVADQFWGLYRERNRVTVNVQ
jgi:NAD(P)-dependent dehydrogenase (short-subunit alcohol dehydrogenase family)